jgi:prevent-host-death family protein
MKLNIFEAKNRLSELVQRAAEGEEVIIANRGKPMARLVKAEAALAEKDETEADIERRFAAYFVEMDRIPDRPDAFDPLEWNDLGLPK